MYAHMNSEEDQHSLYVDHADFQYAEMGTDSANFAISSAKLKYVIKPDMNDEYQCCFFSVLIVLIY
jgi:hypothetical protein